MDEKQLEERIEVGAATLFRVLELENPVSFKILREALSDVVLFDQKQTAYGLENIEIYGELGIIIRLGDKIARLQNMRVKTGITAGRAEGFWNGTN